MGATESGFLLTGNGSPTKVEVLQILQLADLVRNSCENDVRCSMGATESGFLLTRQARTIEQIQ